MISGILGVSGLKNATGYYRIAQKIVYRLPGLARVSFSLYVLTLVLGV